MTELEHYLHSFLGIPEANMQTLVSYFKPTVLEKGEFFLKAGKVCDKLSFHRSGLMRVYAMHHDKEITQWISFKGNIMTELNGLMLNQPSRYNVQALTQCELYTIDKKDYDNLWNVVPQWPQLEKLLITKCYLFVEWRMFSLLSMNAEERYQFLLSNNPELFNEVPLKYLASMMGITPESLSRIRKVKKR